MKNNKLCVQTKSLFILAPNILSLAPESDASAMEYRSALWFSPWSFVLCGNFFRSLPQYRWYKRTDLCIVFLPALMVYFENRRKGTTNFQIMQNSPRKNKNYIVFCRFSGRAHARMLHVEHTRDCNSRAQNAHKNAHTYYTYARERGLVKKFLPIRSLLPIIYPWWGIFSDWLSHSHNSLYLT